MKSLKDGSLSDVATLFGGPAGDFYAIIMGQQLHVGGMAATIELAERAAIGEGQRGIDLCCGNGAAMRVLVRFRNVASMHGIDLTPRNVARGQRELEKESLADRVRISVGDACATNLPSAQADFVWGEDAWCYVPDKTKLVSEAARLVRPGGTIAFSDWVEGPVELDADEAQRTLSLMNFPGLLDVPDYARLLEKAGCEVSVAEDSGRLSSFFDLALKMIDTQFKYDVLATLQFRNDVLKLLRDNLAFLGEMAHAQKLIQACFVARLMP